MSKACLLVQDEPEQEWLETLRPLLLKDGISLHAGPVSDATIAIVANPVPGALAQMPQLRVIASLWAGVDGLLRDTTLPANVPVLRACDEAMRQSINESALSHVLGAHLKLHRYRSLQAAGEWRQLPGALAGERCVGVLGLGYLGGHVAVQLRQLGFQVLGWSRTRKTSLQAQGIECFDSLAGLEQMLSRSDIVLNLLPATANTRGLLNAASFQQCKTGVCLINLARGSHVIEDDLLAALASGKVEHAALDVFSVEPLPAGHPFWKHPQVSMTPHVAGPSHRQSVAESVCRDVRALLAGQSPDSLVNRQLGY